MRVICISCSESNKASKKKTGMKGGWFSMFCPFYSESAFLGPSKPKLAFTYKTA